MGGMIAQEAILMDPCRFGSLTIMSSHSGGLLAAVPPFDGLKSLISIGSLKNSYGSVDVGLSMLFPDHYLEQPVKMEALSKDDHVGFDFGTIQDLYRMRMARRARKQIEGTGKYRPAPLCKYMWVSLVLVCMRFLGDSFLVL